MGIDPVSIAVGFAVSAVTSVASYYLTTKEIEGPRLDSANTPSSTYGQSIPTIYGKSKVAGNLIWVKKIREERKDGNKKKGIPSEYKYYGTFAVLLCEGIVDVSKIWANGKLVYDYYSPSGETQSASSKFGGYLKIYKGTSTQEPDPTIQAIEGVDRTPAFKGKAYIVFNDLPLKEFSNGIPTIQCEVIQAENPFLSDIVKDICKKAGIPENKIDTSELTDKVTGLLINNSGEGYKEVLEQLAKVYFFYITQDKTTGNLLFKKIIRPVTSCSVAFGDMGTRDYGSERIDIYKKIRLQESELPTSLSVGFKNPNLRYNPDTQIVLRNNGEDTNAISLDFNLTLYRTEARYVALILLNQFWLKRNRYEEIILPPKFINAILPGDLITIPLNEVSNVTVQVESVNIGANFLVNLKCTEYKGDCFVAPPIEVDEEIRYDFISNPSAYGSANLFLLDIPLFDSLEIKSGFYAFASSIVPTWSKGTLLTSLDSGNNYQEIINLYLTATGTVQEALPERRTDLVDYASEITVVLDNSNSSAQLFSSTDISFLNGEVLALIGEEIVAFKNATLIANKTYKINTFIRGMFGTPVSNHTENEVFILLKGGNASDYYFYPMEVGQTITAKLQTQGEFFTDIPSIESTYLGVTYKPYTPFNLTYEYNETGVTIQWYRRTNFTRTTGFFYNYQAILLENQDENVFLYTKTAPVENFTVSYDQIENYYANRDSFFVGIFEINQITKGDIAIIEIPIISPYLYDEEENIISDESGNLIYRF